MIRDLFDWTFMDPEKKSLGRELTEIAVLYVIFVVLLFAHERVPVTWVAGLSIVALLGLLWANFRELLRVGLVAGIIVFGVIRPYVVQAFYIPSRSMENTLLVNDHIFVNKFWYRMTNPERWDIIVFEYPNEPSKDYIKRLVGLPGDTVAIRDNQLRVNGERIDRRYLDSEVELRFEGNLLASDVGANPRTLRFEGDGLQLNRELLGNDARAPVRGQFSVVNVYREAQDHRIKYVVKNGIQPEGDFKTNFGPIRVPEPGETVELSELTPAEKRYYFNLMDQWFDEQISLRNEVFYVGGVPTQTLEIREPVYFALGDNRDHSEDSRVWGFVPQHRLLGEAFFIYWPPTRIGLIGDE